MLFFCFTPLCTLLNSMLRSSVSLWHLVRFNSDYTQEKCHSVLESTCRSLQQGKNWNHWRSAKTRLSGCVTLNTRKQRLKKRRTREHCPFTIPTCFWELIIIPAIFMKERYLWMSILYILMRCVMSEWLHACLKANYISNQYSLTYKKVRDTD